MHMHTVALLSLKQHNAFSLQPLIRSCSIFVIVLHIIAHQHQPLHFTWQRCIGVHHCFIALLTEKVLFCSSRRPQFTVLEFKQ